MTKAPAGHDAQHNGPNAAAEDLHHVLLWAGRPRQAMSQPV